MVGHVLSWLWYKLLINMVGAWYLVREQVWDRHRPLPPLPDQAGRTVVMTGGGRGIGEQAVRKLVSSGCHVIVGVRSPDTVRGVFQGLQGVQVLKLDLLDMESVRDFARQVLQLGVPLHVLICNAGIMFGPRRETEEGFEYQLCTNYLGHCLLAHLLLPTMARVEGEVQARIVSVSSCAHHLGSWLDVSDLQLRRGYVPEQAYGNSKVAQLLWAAHLSRVLEERGAGVKVLSLHPGVIYTDLYSSIPGITWIAGLCRAVMKTPGQGGDTLVQAALDPALEASTSPLYLVNSRPASSSSLTRDTRLQGALWEATCRLLDIPPDQFGL